jgi:hypothetical protein
MSWPPSFIRLFLFVMFGTLVFLPKLSFAHQRDSVQLCKLDNERIWYFSVGREVFKVDPPAQSPFSPLIQNVDKAHALVPPDSRSPVGCHNNPQQLNYFNATDWLSLGDGKHPLSEPKRLFVFEISRNWSKLPKQRYTGSDINTLRSEHHLCTSLDFVRAWDDGTVYCTNSEVGLNSLVVPFGTVWQFIISPKIYLTPQGQQLVMTKSFDIQTSYLLTPDLGLSYAWVPPRQVIPVNPGYIVGVDERVQEAVHKLEVKNYLWPQKAD